MSQKHNVPISLQIIQIHKKIQWDKLKSTLGKCSKTIINKEYQFSQRMNTFGFT